MSRSLILFSAMVILCGLFASASWACGADCRCCPKEIVMGERVSAQITCCVGAGAAWSAKAVLSSLKAVPRAVHHAGHHAGAATRRLSAVVSVAANGAQNTIQVICNGVQSLSLDLLRSAFSTIWAYVSALLRC
jgi:hypothetical protein